MQIGPLKTPSPLWGGGFCRLRFVGLIAFDRLNGQAAGFFDALELTGGEGDLELIAVAVTAWITETINGFECPFGKAEFGEPLVQRAERAADLFGEPDAVFAGVLQPSLGLCRYPGPDFALAGL